MGRAEAEDAAVSSRYPHTPTSVSSEGEVGEASGDGDGGSAGRAAGDAVWGARVGGCAVVRVLPVDAVGHLVHDGPADGGGAGCEQGEDGGGRGGGGPVRPRPVRVAEAGDTAGDVEDVLDGEGEAVQGKLLLFFSRRKRKQQEFLHEGAVVSLGLLHGWLLLLLLLLRLGD